MSDTVIKVENLSKLYHLGELHQKTNSFRDKVTSIFKKNSKPKKAETIWALKGVSFEVKRGEVLGIIGRNGAGKSTLLKILSQITKPTEGRVWINGQVGSQLEIGTGFHPELTGRENIFLNGTILGMTKAEIRERFDEIVSFAEIEKFLDTPVKRFSSGMYVRLAFAVAAHLEPDILIIDEVLAVGDAAFQKKCLGKVKEVGHDGKTVLFVSHNMEIIRPLCQRGILLEEGRIIADDDISTVISKYIQSTENNQYSINSYTSREGIGGATIIDVFIESKQDEVQVYADESLTINIDSEIEEEYQNGKQIDIGVGIETIDGRVIMTSVSSWAGYTVFTSGKLLAVKCKIPFLPFVPGSYLISISIIHNNKQLDGITHCAKFVILDKTKDILYTNRYKFHGDIDIPCQYYINSELS